MFTFSKANRFLVLDKYNVELEICLKLGVQTYLESYSLSTTMEDPRRTRSILQLFNGSLGLDMFLSSML